MIPGDAPKVHYITAEFTEHVSIYDYFKSISYGLAVASYMSGFRQVGLMSDEISRASKQLEL